MKADQPGGQPREGGPGMLKARLGALPPFPGLLLLVRLGGKVSNGFFSETRSHVAQAGPELYM